MFARETLPDGSTRLSSERGSFTFTRPRPGVFLVRITGYDQGEFGDAPFDAMQAEINRFKRIELFVDTREVFGAATAVREAWTEWLKLHASELVRAHLVSGSKLVFMALTVAKELSRTGDLIRVYSDPAAFDDALARAAAARP